MSLSSYLQPNKALGKLPRMFALDDNGGVGWIKIYNLFLWVKYQVLLFQHIHTRSSWEIMDGSL